MQHTYRSGLGLVVAVVGGVACQIVPLQQQFDESPPVRIVEFGPSESGALQLQLAFEAPVRATILRSERAEAALEPVAPVNGQPGETRDWEDPAVLDTPGVRYYRVQTRLGDQQWSDPVEWAVFTRMRRAGQRDLLSVPVDLGEGARLDGELGRQLAWRGHAGSGTNDADHVAYLSTQGRWETAFLKSAGEGNAQWWDSALDAPAVAVIAPGQAFWYARAPAAGGDTVGALWGPVYTRPSPVSIRLDTRAGTPIGLPWSRPLRHPVPQTPAAGEAVAPDPLGFGGLGSGGVTSDPRRPDEGGDQLWVWGDGEWKGYYWLMDHLGPARDGRWWDGRTRAYADFALEPGLGYYYRHRPNRWGGADFVWNPPVLPTSVENP